MKKYNYEAKTKEEAINKALEELNTTEENIIVKVLEEKQGLLKKVVKIEVTKVNDLVDYLKECINKITSLMNIKVNLEVRIRENNIDSDYRLNLDIENYREKKISNLERTAKKIAREVKFTKVETKLDAMNSYERRIIHNTLSNNKYVYTESIGEEPNRYVVIKPKED